MYSSTFLRVQLDLNVFLPARVSYTCVTYGLLLTKRYVYPPPKGSLVYEFNIRVQYTRCSIQLESGRKGFHRTHASIAKVGQIIDTHLQLLSAMALSSPGVQAFTLRATGRPTMCVPHCDGEEKKRGWICRDI